MKKVCPATLLVFMLIFVLISSVQAQSPQETLKRYISDLQKNPNDNALREKIIKHVRTMRPAPAMPEEARRYFIEGNVLIKAAKEQKGYGLAIDAYQQCLLIAPWWAEAYYNYAVALDLAEKFDQGINALKLFIATNPGGEEARKAQDKIYEMGAKKKLAAQERESSSQQTAAAPKQNTFEDLLRKINGRRYFNRDAVGNVHTLDVKGKVLVWNAAGSSEWERFDIKGREFTCTPRLRPWEEFTFIISEDGNKITNRVIRHSDNAKAEIIYLWQR